MGHKRKCSDEDRIAKTIRKLERKLKRRRRIISSDDSEAEIEQQNEELPVNGECITNPGPSTEVDTEAIVPEKSAPDVATSELANNTSTQEEEAELEEDVLQILGEAPQPNLVFGKNIHKDLASRWQDILLKGLNKDVKEALLKKYLIPANCNFLVAPLLNPEAKAAVPEVLAKRDTTLLQKQNQLGVALAALSQVSEMIIRNESSKQALLQPLSDACRMLCDSHFIETKTRRSILMSAINTSLRETLINANRDKYLFGEDLAEKLKAAKSVQKTGESLGQTHAVTTSNKNNNPKNNPRRNLNYRGPIQRKPPIRGSESSRGRPPVRQTRPPANSRQPQPPPKTLSPHRRNYRR